MARTSGTVSIVGTYIALFDFEGAKEVASTIPDGDDKKAALAAIAKAEAKVEARKAGTD